MENYVFPEKASSRKNGKSIKYVIDKESGCWNCTSHFKNNGYPKISRNGHQTNIGRYIYETYYDKKLEAGLVIRHKCDNPSCINPEHLVSGTVKQNSQDMVERNRASRQVLTKEQVLEIKTLLIYTDYTASKIGEMFGVGFGAIASIRDGQTWTFVTGGKIERLKTPRRHNQVLDEKSVEVIKKLYSKNVLTQQEIGELFDVKQSTITSILTGKIWK